MAVQRSSFEIRAIKNVSIFGKENNEMQMIARAIMLLQRTVNELVDEVNSMQEKEGE